MIPAGFLQDLLSRVDIVDVVGRHVQLKKGGVNLMGLCPFHGEKSPSFSVSPAKQFYYCFGCGASGDAVKFLVEFSGLGFREAVTELAHASWQRRAKQDIARCVAEVVPDSASLFIGIGTTPRAMRPGSGRARQSARHDQQPERGARAEPQSELRDNTRWRTVAQRRP